MELKIILFYCLSDDILTSMGWYDDQQQTMSTAEVMTVALTAAAFFSGNYERSREFLQEYGYIRAMLSKSQFNRRLNRIPESVWCKLMMQLMKPFNESNSLKIYLIDSFPVPVCRNIRINRCKIYQDKSFRGYIPSRKEYFYGLKVHTLITESGIPVEIFLSPGSYADVNSLYDFSFLVPEGCLIYGDRAYNAYDIEDELKLSDISLNPIRKKNSKRKYESLAEDGIKIIRKRVESIFSVISQKFPKHIHAVTSRGFELKVFLFILAYGIEKTML